MAHIRKIAAVVLAAGLLILSCGVAEQPSSAQSSEPFKVGILLCLSGECSEWGENSLRGLTLAAREINANGGVLGRPIELVVEDTQEASNGAKAVSAFRRLYAQSDVRFFVGPTWTPAGLALAPIIAKTQDVIITSPSLGVEEFNATADNIFNTFPHNHVSTRKLARYALCQGWQRAAILSSEQPFEKRQADYFEDEFTTAGGSIALRIDHQPLAADLRTEALKIAAQRPDVIFLADTNRMGLAARTLRQLGYKGQLLSAEIDHTRINDAQGALEGCVSARFPEAAKEFAERVSQAHSVAPGISSDTAYDTLYLYAQAIRSAASFEAQKVKVSILHAKLDGASGTIAFDATGGVMREPALVQVNNASLTTLEAESCE